MTSPTGKPTPAALRELWRRDPKLARAARVLPPFPGFPSAENRRLGHYPYLARAIVYQQLSGKAAATIWSRVLALRPGGFPPAAELLVLDQQSLRGAGLSKQKVLALLSLAEHVAVGKLRFSSLARWPDERIVEHLTEVRGVGRWTAQMFLLFRLGRLDVLPTGDLGVQEGLRRLHGWDARPTPAQVAELAAPWHPLASVGSWLMWRLADS